MQHTPEYRRILHRMGYYSYQSGLIYRHLNQEGGWDGHNLKCRSYILNSLDFFSPQKVTILGSGWLLDIPLAEIAERTGSVELVDIVHPPDVKKQVSVYRNVCLKEADVTGGLISEVWNSVHKSFFRRTKSISEIRIPEYRPDEDPGLVISLNILTQLENLPSEYLRKKTSIPDAEFDIFRKCIQKKHVEFLSRHKSVLISDFEEVFTGEKGDRKVVPTLRTDLPEGKMKDEWIWDFDARGSDYYTSSSVLKVLAITYS
jgi:hypothetical protein